MIVSSASLHHMGAAFLAASASGRSMSLWALLLVIAGGRAVTHPAIANPKTDSVTILASVLNNLANLGRLPVRNELVEDADDPAENAEYESHFTTLCTPSNRLTFCLFSPSSCVALGNFCAALGCSF